MQVSGPPQAAQVMARLSGAAFGVGSGIGYGTCVQPSYPSLPGLCGGCAHARRVQSNRGSMFVLCAVGLRDPRFSKYPVLPVWRCAAHQPMAPNIDEAIIEPGETSES